MSTRLIHTLEEVGALLDIGIALSAEKDHDCLLDRIVTEARRITSADAGTLYLCEGDQLVFKIIHNETMNVFAGGKGEPVTLPPVPMRPENVSAYTALKREVVNIADVYQAEGFDFSGPKRYDQMTGYRTGSMLVLPLENHESDIIGVLQLINAKDSEGKVIPFAPYLEKVVTSLASQAAISMTNRRLLEDIEQLFNSFVEVMATAIDAQTPYNANHTRRVAQLAGALARAINETKEGPWATELFDEQRLKQLIMSAWLHDIGKITTPLAVMNKATRLGDRREIVLLRLDSIASALRRDYLEAKLVALEKGVPAEQERVEAEWNDAWAEWQRIREMIVAADDPAGRITPEIVQVLQSLSERTYVDAEGKRQTWLTAAEVEALSVFRGTLTEEERRQMEGHVEVTERLLAKVPFPPKMANVPRWAAMHHEHLDGKGYPQRLSGDAIPVEARILSLVDVYDALTASDRPYKKAMPVEDALRILGFMVKDGKLDEGLFRIFCDQRVWEMIE
ncbi:HD domain-containing protein [Heliobacterium gestii]|uniref:HD domain-containing protein n=1 Tax=Heliomicrobium gestii TaxID=2699 RepID=A0A845LFT7_HELGE|nr:HD domain-containing phosphohydrolase [Heliomicrobium gestii]MBM7868227.1 HD-GYP domain-containing protein (c-di-GMP phosphodiesterase class II) [Heliomicrobium gestii]MZP44421.1 HD domain-containing protein [Heliomicrobium gestii]